MRCTVRSLILLCLLAVPGSAAAAVPDLAFRHQQLATYTGPPVEAVAAEFGTDERMDAFVLTTGQAGTATSLFGFTSILTSNATLGSSHSGGVAQGLAAGHLDTDASLDPVYSSSVTAGNPVAQARIWWNRGDGQVAASGCLTACATPGSATVRGIAAGRVGLDFINDVLVLDAAAAPTITSHLSNGDRTFDPPIVSPLPAGSEPREVAVLGAGLPGLGDFHPDAVVTLAASSTLAFLPGNAATEGAYDAPVQVLLAGMPDALAVANLVGDGTDDVIVALPSQGSVQIVDGATQVAGAPIVVGGAPVDVSGGGIDDGSGRDIVVADAAAGVVRVFQRDGATYTAGPTLPVAGAGAVQIVDLDLDGRNDVFVAGATRMHAFLTRPVIVHDPTALELGTTPINAIGAPRTVTFRNLGGPPLDVDGVRVSGAAATDFLVVADGCSGASVPFGGSCKVDIRFAPTAVGERLAALGLLGDGPDGGLPSTSLSGTGAAPGGAPGPPTDTTVSLDLNAASTQKLKKLAITAGCGAEACSVEASGSVTARKPPKKGMSAVAKPLRFALLPASASIGAGETERLALKVKGQKKLAALLRLRERGARATAKVTVTATDAAGNQVTEARSVRLK